ncbi:MAG: TonB family protein [Candidatus Eisenbacteria bacterium]|nr:TonB family protein [Candidatus Eisenbacteria bacterium]
MKRIAGTLAVFALVLPLLRGVAVAGGPPDGSILSNVEFMQLAVRGSVLEAFRNLPLDGTEPIRLHSESPSEIDWFVENEVAGALGKLGFGLELDSSPRATFRRHSPGKRAATGPVVGQYDKAPVQTVGGGIPYPGKACRKGLEGTVTVMLLLNEVGAVANVVVEESTDQAFESVVVEGVEAYRFTPAEKDGEPINAALRMRFDFPEAGDDCSEATVEGVLLDGNEEDAEEPEEETVAGSEEIVDEAEPGSGAVLHYRVSEMELRYPQVSRRLWFGPKRVDRLARTRIDFRLMDGSTLLWAESSEHLVTDRVPFGAIRFLETDQFPFARPEMPESGGGRIIEPLAVAGVIGGLIVLFYANQAGN